MEEQVFLFGRRVQFEFEPRRDAVERLADAYRRLAPLPREIRRRVESVQRHVPRPAAERIVMEAVS